MDVMNEQDNKIIQKNYVRLLETLEVHNLLGYLYQEGALSDHDKEKIYALGTSKEKAETLLVIIKKRKDGLKMLIKALILSRVQGFLGNELLEIVTWSEQEMETFKLELQGKIDHQQMLEANVAALRQEINQLKEKNANLTERLKEKDETINALRQQLQEKNGRDVQKQAKFKLPHLSIHV